MRFELKMSLSMSVLYHLQTLWLFTCQQFIDTITPVAMFGVGTTVSGVIKTLPHSSFQDALLRIPIVYIWLWVLILQFNIHNQVGEKSIAEDAINKPWRPLPAGRITSGQAKVLMGFTSVVALASSLYLKTFPHFVGWIVVITVYDNFGGSDAGAFIRNFWNAAGYLCLFTGGLKIASQADDGLSQEAYQWALLMDLIIFSTCQSQDFRDEEGDKARGRLTVLTTIGKTAARWTLSAAILFWSFYLPLWFEVGILQAPLLIVLGMIVTGMNTMGLRKSDVSLDGMMYKFWGVWLFGCCSMPLQKAIAT